MSGKKVLHRGRHVELVRDGKWEFARRVKGRAVVGMVAVTAAKELLLVEQHRSPVASPVIELPAGLVGDEVPNEDLADATRRELEEETGYTAEHVSILSRVPSSAGLTDEVVTLVRASGLRLVGSGGGVEDESIAVHRVPLTEVSEWLAARTAKGQLIDPRVFAALWWLAREEK
jgi:ADP-ribose pyrophosphatase